MPKNKKPSKEAQLQDFFTQMIKQGVFQPLVAPPKALTKVHALAKKAKRLPNKK